MTGIIITALIVFGLSLLFFAITNTDARPARRATAAGTGLFALLLAAVLGVTHDHDRGDDL
jgi:hypothetical protein